MSNDPVTLTNCDREPIHIPGAIQPHGVLLACRGQALTIVQASENAAAHLGTDVDGLLGLSVGDVLSASSWERLLAAIASGRVAEFNPLPFETSNGGAFDGIVHLSATDGVTIVELEPRREVLRGFHPQMRKSVRQLQTATGLADLFTIAAREVRALTGFDRVMVYRFDREWNGEVVAEDRVETLEPFLGQHYPAADIPVQARRLYTLNWLRIIPDVNYRPAAIRPTLEPETKAPLDLSFSVLRSVSPIHIEYLRNMGVTASMSVSLVRDGVLIGLIACHHYSGPHFVPFSIRDTAEYLGQALSWHTTAFEEREAAERAAETQRAESILLESISDKHSVIEGLCVPELLELTSSQGAAVLYEGQIGTVGVTPPESGIKKLVEQLSSVDGAWIHQTDQLSTLLPAATDWDDTGAGMLAVAISQELGEYVIWFRPATARTVNWAGDPRKIESVDDQGAPRLSPRGSFALWIETVRGRSLPWEPWQVTAAGNLRRLLLGSVRRRSNELRLINNRLSEADRMKDEFLATVGHELRTPLNAMLGWLHLLRAAPEHAQPRDSREQRALDTIERNARVQAQLIDDLLDVSRIVSGKLTLNVQPVELATLIERALDAVRPAAEAKQIKLQPALDVTAVVRGDPHRLQQVASNLLTNAIKFTPKGGRVQVLVERQDSSAEITVVDTGQGIAKEFLPQVFDRFRQADSTTTRKSSGLGLGLAIVRHLVELHGGTITAHSEGPGRGATFTVKLPLAPAARAHVAAHRETAIPDCPPELAGLRVLVLDDDQDSREMLKSVLEHCDIDVTTESSAQAALELLTTWQPDMIISDIGMPEMDGFMFIEQLRARPAETGGRIPAVALTAHARMNDRARALYSGFNNHLPKPVEPQELYAVLASLQRGGRSNS